ncbi:MAG: adenylate/guanylate cyclase domain-containing protein [Planctomycetota bacterium]
MRTRNLTLLLSDVKGYTERQSRSSRQEIEEELVRHRTLLQPIFEGFGGRVVKTMGDAFLVAFESPTDAVHAAVQVQKALDAQNARVADPARATHVRVAISTGEVTEDEAGDVFGEPVNLAARLEGIAEAGTIYLTETTFLSMNRNEIPTLEVGHRVFKGIPDEVKVYRILDDYVARARLLSPAEMRHAARVASASAPAAAARGRGLVLALAGALLVAGGGIVALLVARRDPPAAPAPAAAAPDLLTAMAAAAAKDPSQMAALGLLLKKNVLGLAKEGSFDAARDLARKAHELAPALVGPRDLWIDINRMELEDAVEKGTVDALVHQNPPAWYDAHVLALHERFANVPRYQWLRATWFLASDPTRAETADLVDAALAANDDARKSEALRTLLVAAVAATVGDARLHGRYQDLLERVEKPTSPGPVKPGPGGGRRTVPGRRDR